MVGEPRISNGSDAVSFALVPCAKSNGNSCEIGDENNKTEMKSVNGDGIFKRTRQWHSSCEYNMRTRQSHSSIGLEGGQSMDKVLVQCKMVIDSRVNNRGDAVSLSLLSCAKSNGNSCGSEDENNNHMTEVFSDNGVQSCKRRRESQSSSEDNIPEGAIIIALEAAGQLMEKDSNNEQLGNISDGSCTNDQPNAHVVFEPDQGVSHDLVVAEKYDALRKLLSKSLQGVIRVESFSDFSTISSRMKDGAYSRSPQLFSKDVEQIGLKFQKIGAEMVSLAEGLSDMSRKLYLEQVVGSANGTCVEEKHMETNQIHTGNMDRQCKPEQVELDETCVCNCCKGETNNRICIVCDSCEKIYHVFCAGISVSKNSPRMWYCMNCVAAGLGSAHENCVVCDKKPNCCPKPEPERTSSSQSCKLCRCKFEDIQYQECEHSMCLNKFHTRCLSELELKSFGPRWYCPSCLCRVCLVDQDDEKIVLCDGCDNAYHIYCMEPPRGCVPEGKWFCRVCDMRIEAIRRAKRKSNSGVEPVDMLLSAAKELEK